jgi:hypothetical protein
MKIIKVEENHFEKLEKFCHHCSSLGWVNNATIEKLRIEKVKENDGAYFAIEENEEIVSIAGCYKFIEYSLNSWRIFYRSATLPGKAKNPGLHRGTGERGRLYINAFLDYTNSENLFFTTNIENSEWNNITRYHTHMLKESSLLDSYVEYCETKNLLGAEQAIWKLNNEKYYRRTHKRAGANTV